MRSKKDLLILLGVSAISVMLWFVKLDLPSLPREYALFFINETASLPRGLYMKIPAWDFKEGDYVVYQPTLCAQEIANRRGWLESDGLLLKQVGALSGTEYRISPKTGSFFIRDQYYGKAYPVDREGKEMPVSYGLFIVPKDSFLPVGTAPRSFDGRYTGTVPLKNIVAKVVPLLTE